MDESTRDIISGNGDLNNKIIQLNEAGLIARGWVEMLRENIAGGFVHMSVFMYGDYPS